MAIKSQKATGKSAPVVKAKTPPAQTTENNWTGRKTSKMPGKKGK